MRDAQASKIAAWELFATNLQPLLEEMPYLQPFHDRIRGLIEQARELDQQQESEGGGAGPHPPAPRCGEGGREPARPGLGPPAGDLRVHERAPDPVRHHPSAQRAPSRAGRRRELRARRPVAPSR
jgi:hypothetical protein